MIHTLAIPHNSTCSPAAQGATYVVFILHVDLSAVLPQAHGLFLGYLLVLAIVSLIAQRGGGCQHERASDYCCKEGETEECERVLLQRFAVPGGDGVGQR